MTTILILAVAVLALAVLLLQIRLSRQAKTGRAVEERLRQENAERREALGLLKLQRDLAEELGAQVSMQDSLRCILDMLATIPGVDCGGVYLVQPDGNLELAAHKNLSEAFVAANTRVAGDSSRGKWVHEGRVFAMDYNTLKADALLEGIRSLLVVPIQFQSRLVAVLNMGSRSVPAFQPHMQTTIEAVAEHIGGIVSRIRAQENMKERDHSFRNLAESAFDAIAIVGADRRFLYANPQFSELTGYSHSELIGELFEKTLHPDQRPLINARFDERMKGLSVPSRYEALFYRKDGATVPVRFSGRRIAWMGQPAVIGYIQDLSGQKRSEKSLLEAKETMDAFFDFIPIPVMILDEKTRIVRINIAGLELATAGNITELLNKQPGDALRCVHRHESTGGCGLGPNCPVCDLRRALDSVLSVDGSVRGMEAFVQLTRADQPCKVVLRINAEPINLNDRRHVVVALEDVTSRRQALSRN